MLLANSYASTSKATEYQSIEAKKFLKYPEKGVVYFLQMKSSDGSLNTAQKIVKY